MGTLYIVATPIGNLGDISKRALEILESVDLVLCEDTRHSLKLFNYFDIKNKLIAYHKFNEKEKSSSVLKQLQDGKNMALITDAGTPLICDPGYVIVELARKNNIEVIGIPGPSAVITSLSISGFEVNNFSFYGFFPRITKDKKELINNIKKSDINLFVFYESPKRIMDSLEYISNELNKSKVFVASDITKLHEKHYFGDINDVIDELKNNEKSNLGEYTIILKKENQEENKLQDISIEAMLVDIIVKDNVGLKEAIEILSKSTNLSKKDIYNASLNLKKLF